MTNAELTEWEHRPEIIKVFTSYEMGAWLHRRDGRLLEQIKAEVEALSDKDYITDGITTYGWKHKNGETVKSEVLEIIDKHIKEHTET